MNININEKLVATLNKLAEVRSMTPEVYLENFVDSHLLSQYKQEVVDKIQNETLDNVVELDSVVSVKKAEIQEAFALANLVVKNPIVDGKTFTEGL